MQTWPLLHAGVFLLKDMEVFMERVNRKKLFPSHFLRSHVRNGLVVLTHQLNVAPVYMQRGVWREIQRTLELGEEHSPHSQLIQDLLDRRLLIRESDEDQKDFKKVQELAQQALNRPTILYLMLEQSCDFSCSYCPIPRAMKKYGKKSLTLADAKRGIDLWFEHLHAFGDDGKPFYIIFYGGEPLLNRVLLEQLLPYIGQRQNQEQLPQSLELMLCTNGAHVDLPVSKLLAQYHVTVAVGLDGPAVFNDQTRRTREGASTYTPTVQAVDKLISQNVRVVVSSTITPGNLPFVRDFPKFFQSLGISGFGYNLLKGEALRQVASDLGLQKYCSLAAQAVLAGLSDVKAGEAYEYQLQKKLDILRLQQAFSVDCTCYGNQLVIQPNGQVTNCPFLRKHQGHISELLLSFRIHTAPVVQEWRSRIPVLQQFKDLEQEGDFLTGGGCAWSSTEFHGDVHQKDITNTLFVQEVMHGLIWSQLTNERGEAIRRRNTTHWCYRWDGIVLPPVTRESNFT